MKTIVMSIDPALTNTAIVVFEDSKIKHIEVFKPSRPTDAWLTVAEKTRIRQGEITQGILKHIEKYKPKAICVEQAQAGAKSAKAASAMALIAGMLNTLAVTHSHIIWEFIRVAEVKRAVVGRAQATKNEMIEGVLKIYPDLYDQFKSKRGKSWTGEAEHITDAIAVYLAFKETPVGKLICQENG